MNTDDYKKILIAKRDRLLESLKDFKEVSKPVDLDTPIGRISRMDAISEQQIKLESKRQTELTLKKIESALQRIENGTFGICLKCEEEISEKRLKAAPETLYCLDCQNE